METPRENTPVSSYDAPAVIYEVALVAHAGPSTSGQPGCTLSGGDLLDPIQKP
jgi:hypothetical protein